jgi:hypothetical protein
MWIGGILAGGTIAGFALVTTQLIRLTGEVSALAESSEACKGANLIQLGTGAHDCFV